MSTEDIIKRVSEVMGITSLNPMQRAMADNRAPQTILLAPTGSGKTLAFAIPMISAMREHNGYVQALVIAPSRELVTQIADVVRPLALPLRTVAFYGGHSMLDETRSLATMPDIIIATPGRILDHLNRGNLRLNHLRVLVLDEYDKSLDLGFHDDMKRIVRKIEPADDRVLKIILTSATRLTELPDFLRLKGPVVMDFTAAGYEPASRIEFARVPTPARDKLDIAMDLVASLPAGSKAIVFVNHRESAERVYQAMKRDGFPVGLYHGGLDQRQREMAVDLLNNGTTPILISSDLASRGLDIANVDAVIHYHLPPSAETWTHRNGRTARQGASGTVYTIINEDETIPECVEWERDFIPPFRGQERPSSVTATLYFNAGKREKISRGDIAGYLIQKGGLNADEVGKIVVRDHYSLAAIPTDKLTETLAAIAPHKLKNRRVRVTPING